MTDLDSPAQSPCAELFRREALPLPPLPAEFLAAMQPRGGAAFATASWQGSAPLPSAASRWLAQGIEQPAAWCGLEERGVHSTAAQVGLATRRYGLFMRKFVSQALADAAAHRLALEGSFALMRRIFAAIESAQAWPAGKRLVVVDDDTARFRWGWVGGKAGWQDLIEEATPWITPLVSLESLALARR